MNLFIVDSDTLTLTGLKHYLNNRFGRDLNISLFNNGESCLQKVDKNTDLVILGYSLNGKTGNDILPEIKAINPKTEVIIFSSNENVSVAIESFRKGATDYVIKGGKAWRKLSSLVYRAITEPLRKMGYEYNVSKFAVIFLSVFITMGIVVYITLRFYFGIDFPFFK